MIVVTNASHSVPKDGRRHWILKNQSLVIGDRERIGIFAANGSGKTILARLFSGSDQPDFGTVKHSRSTSWPIGTAGIIHQDLTLAENLDVTLRLATAMRPLALKRFNRLFGGEVPLREKAKEMSPSQRALFAYALSMMVPQQHYIFDEKVTTGHSSQRAKQDAFLSDELRTKGMVLFSSNTRTLSKYCYRFFRLEEAKLIETSHMSLTMEGLGHV